MHQTHLFLVSVLISTVTSITSLWNVVLKVSNRNKAASGCIRILQYHHNSKDFFYVVQEAGILSCIISSPQSHTLPLLFGSTNVNRVLSFRHQTCGLVIHKEVIRFLSYISYIRGTLFIADDSQVKRKLRTLLHK